MSKIICDVCGTRYPDTADQCPICGHIREAAGKTTEDLLIMDDMRSESHERVRGGRFSKSNVEKRTKAAGSFEPAPARSKAAKKVEKAPKERPAPQEEDIFIEDKQNKNANTILNILLVIVILALLAVTGYIFMQHVLPQLTKTEPTVAPTIPVTEPVITQPLETEEPTYPCEELVFEETEVLLTEYEEKWLINVDVKPENTTDKLTFTSGNELIATVDSEGCITALAEGETYITVSCGDIVQEYKVLCLFPGVDIKPGEEPPTEPPTEPPVEMKTTANVNVRSGPGAAYDWVTKYNKGKTVTVYEKKMASDGTEWGRTDDGWFCLKYAKEAE